MPDRASADLDEYRSKSRGQWDRIASTWDRERSFLSSATRKVSRRLIDRLDAQSGQTVLELAAGTGEMTAGLADAVGAAGKVISTDFAPSMVEAARAESERSGLANVEHRVLDAERMDLMDSSVDRVACRFAYMLMADPAAAFAETRRVLNDDGRLCFAVWSTADRNPWASIPGRTMVELGFVPPPDPGLPGPFSMGDESALRELLAETGFGEAEIEEVRVHWGYADADEHWNRTVTLSPGTRERLAELSGEDRERVRTEVAGRVAARLREGGEGMDGLALVVAAS